jgi:hypothetical protein
MWIDLFMSVYVYPGRESAPFRHVMCVCVPSCIIILCWFHDCSVARPMPNDTHETKEEASNPEADYLHSINVFLGLIDDQLPPASCPGTMSNDADAGSIQCPYFPDYRSLHAVEVNLGRLEDVDCADSGDVGLHLNGCNPHTLPSFGTLPQRWQIEACLTALFDTGHMLIVPSDQPPIPGGNHVVDGQTVVQGLDVLVQGNCDRPNNCHSTCHLSLRVLNDARSRERGDEHYTLCLLETDDDDEAFARQIHPLIDEINYLEGKLFNDLRAEKSYKLRLFISGDCKFLQIAKLCQSNRA